MPYKESGRSTSCRVSRDDVRGFQDASIDLLCTVSVRLDLDLQ